MSVAITSLVFNSNGTWTYSWDDVGQTLSRVVLWGEELARITDGPPWSYTLTGSHYGRFPAPLEISNSEALVLTEVYFPYVTFQWYGESCQFYAVQQSTDNGVTWSTVQTQDEVNAWVYSYLTGLLVDETTYLYRVIALDGYGNDGTPRSYTAYMVTVPDEPDRSIVITYANPNVIISAV